MARYRVPNTQDNSAGAIAAPSPAGTEPMQARGAQEQRVTQGEVRTALGAVPLPAKWQTPDRKWAANKGYSKRNNPTAHGWIYEEGSAKSGAQKLGSPALRHHGVTLLGKQRDAHGYPAPAPKGKALTRGSTARPGISANHPPGNLGDVAPSETEPKTTTQTKKEGAGRAPAPARSSRAAVAPHGSAGGARLLRPQPSGRGPALGLFMKTSTARNAPRGIPASFPRAI